MQNAELQYFIEKTIGAKINMASSYVTLWKPYSSVCLYV